MASSTTPPPRTFIRGLLLAVLVLSSLAPLASPMLASEITDDRAHRDATIHWPAEFDPSVTPVFSHNELLLHADCQRAFDRLADATSWPGWFPLVRDVAFESPAPMREGTLLRLRIFNSPIQSRVVEFVPGSRISWIPFGADETETRHGHFHTWHFVPQAGGCRVVTEETGISANDRKDPAAASHLMHQAHELWLDGLRYASEP